MILTSYLIADGTCYRHLVTNTIDPDVISKANDIFNLYRMRGIILSDSIHDSSWVLTNERLRVIFHFKVDESIYEARAAQWLNCPSDTFVACLKAFILMNLGNIELKTLNQICGSILSIAESPDPFVVVPAYPNRIAQFLRLLPGTTLTKEELSRRLDEIPMAESAGNQRLLADFTTYLRFNDSLRDIWPELTLKDKVFFFPLWLWWNLTTILPLRPTEFVLTPYDCLSTENSIEKITVRRTHLKGGGKKISYSIEGDYDFYSYPVTPEISSEIKWYRDSLIHLGYCSDKYLFNVKYYQDYIKTKDPYRKGRLYLYRHLKMTLSLFIKRFPTCNLELSNSLGLGDTRHLAMISLIISGGSPVICRELAGHENIAISSHYYSNMATLVESATYESYRKSCKGGSPASMTDRQDIYLFNQLPKRTRINGGWCGSERFANHSVEDCICSISEQGELGICENCKYFCPDMPGHTFHFEDINYNRERVKSDSWFLMFIVETVRKGVGTHGDLRGALMRLQNSCSDYRTAILNSLYRRGHNDYGTTPKK